MRAVIVVNRFRDSSEMYQMFWKSLARRGLIIKPSSSMRFDILWVKRRIQLAVGIEFIYKLRTGFIFFGSIQNGFSSIISNYRQRNCVCRVCVCVGFNNLSNVDVSCYETFNLSLARFLSLISAL